MYVYCFLVLLRILRKLHFVWLVLVHTQSGCFIQRLCTSTFYVARSESKVESPLLGYMTESGNKLFHRHLFARKTVVNSFIHFTHILWTTHLLEYRRLSCASSFVICGCTVQHQTVISGIICCIPHFASLNKLLHALDAPNCRTTWIRYSAIAKKIITTNTISLQSQKKFIKIPEQ